MKLDKESILWGIEHVYKDSDTDLFPKPAEINIIYNDKEHVSSKLENIDISNYTWKPCRRFIIPKSDLSYRVATQLDPLDSILLAAIIYQFGNKIESKRVPTEEKRYSITVLTQVLMDIFIVIMIHGTNFGVLVKKKHRIINSRYMLI